MLQPELSNAQQGMALVTPPPPALLLRVLAGQLRHQSLSTAPAGKKRQPALTGSSSVAGALYVMLEDLQASLPTSQLCWLLQESTLLHRPERAASCTCSACLNCTAGYRQEISTLYFSELN